MGGGPLTGERFFVCAAFAGILAVSGCGGEGSETLAQDFQDSLDELAAAEEYAMSVDVTAPPEAEALSGHYEVEFQAPDRYRAESDEAQYLIIGDVTYLRTEVGWDVFDSGEPVPDQVRPRTLVTLLNDPCTIEGTPENLRVELRSRAGECKQVGTATVTRADDRVTRVDLVLDIGEDVIEIAIAFRWDDIEDIQPPESTPTVSGLTVP